MALHKLFGKAPLKRANGSEVTLDSLAGADSYVGVYFSAHWCGPCRQFTPVLAKFYNRMREAGKKFEIIFVSADRSEDDYREYLSEMPWTALPFNSPLAAPLNKKFKVQGIPHFAIISGSTGKIVCADGRAQVLSDSAGTAFPWPKPTFKQAFDKTFVSASGKDVTFAEISKLDAVGIYFSAHWCGPCKRFTPQLIKTYNAVKAAGKSFELIFVSSDRSAEEFSGYFSTMPWLSYPFVDKEGRAAAGRYLPHQGIPSLFIVDPKTGKVINSSGRMAISKDPKGAEFPWVPKAAPALGEGADINSAPIMSLLLDGVEDFDAADECLAAFQAFAKSTKASWDSAKDDEEDDYPLDFGYGDDDVELVGQIRSVLALGRVPSPTLLIIDVPSGVKYMWTGKAGTYPTAKDFAAMVDGYVKGSLTPVGLKG